MMAGSVNTASYKILVIGDSNVGKTCLIHRFSDGLFHERFISTIGIDCKQKTIEVENTTVALKIWDTAGQERFRTLTSAYYRGAQGIVLVYDITQEDTFKQLTYWTRNISKMAAPEICQILVGNKSDLSGMRKVKTETAKEFAESLDLTHIETSCKEGYNVNDVFQILTQNIHEVHQRIKLNHKSNLRKSSMQVTAESDQSEVKSSCRC